MPERSETQDCLECCSQEDSAECLSWAPRGVLGGCTEPTTIISRLPQKASSEHRGYRWALAQPHGTQNNETCRVSRRRQEATTFRPACVSFSAESKLWESLSACSLESFRFRLGSTEMVPEWARALVTRSSISLPHGTCSGGRPSTSTWALQVDSSLPSVRSQVQPRLRAPGWLVGLPPVRSQVAAVGAMPLGGN